MIEPMITALLPVKIFVRSKERLAGFLSPAERAQLALTMFEDVWAALQQACAMANALDRLLVISAEPYVIARCR
jgi:2-phospho-L-lactate guanylyltransferase